MTNQQLIDLRVTIMSLQDLEHNMKHRQTIDRLREEGNSLDSPVFIETLLKIYGYGPGEGKHAAAEHLLAEAFKNTKHAYTDYYAESIKSAKDPLNLISAGFHVEEPMRLFVSRLNVAIPIEIQAGALLRHWVDTKKLIPRCDLYTKLISTNVKETSALLAPIEEQQGLERGTLLTELKQQLLHDMCKQRMFESRDRWEILAQHTDVSTLDHTETANFIRNVYHGIDVSIFQYDGTHAVTMMDLVPLDEKQVILARICGSLPGWSNIKTLVDTHQTLGMSVEKIYLDVNYMASLLKPDGPGVKCPEFTV